MATRNIKKKAAFVCLDCETGGVDENDSDLLSFFAAITDEDFNILATLGEVHTEPMNGVYRVTPGALKVNKIDLTVRENVVNYLRAGEMLHQFLMTHKPGGNGKLVFLNHNAAFDIGYVNQFLINKKAWQKIISVTPADTKITGRALMDSGVVDKGAGNLEWWAKYFNIINEAPHTGRGDVLTTIAVYQNQLRVLRELAAKR